VSDSGRAILSEALGERYQFAAKLGAGAFGEVYRARDTVLGREVAIKRIRLDAFADESQLDDLKKRFLREAQVAAGLRHPNIVTTHDIVSAPRTEKMSFIVMELVEGRTLASLLKERGRLGLSETLELLGQVGSALDHAHQSHVVHRDVKPANIMIEPSGRVKVMDFGIAKLDSGTNLTATGNIVGTPNYMSPEQARGEKVDGRSDLFSLGSILYECLSGEKAFKGDSVTGILMKVLTEEPGPIDFRALGLPPELNGVLSRAMAKSPGDRFASGAELFAAIRDVAEHPAAATAISAAPRAAAPASAAARSPRRLPWAVAILLALAAAILWSQGSPRRPSEASGDAGSDLVVEEEPSLLGRLLGRKATLAITIPAGTELSLELETALTSETAESGDEFTATLRKTIAIEGVEAVPEGSKIAGHVSYAAGAGKTAGRGALTLELDSLELEDGGAIDLRAEPIAFEARSTRKKDAGVIGGLAGVGAVVGGIVGGKKGAVIGGAAGGGAGTAVVLTTRGEEVVLPEGADFPARLQSPLTVRRDKPGS
jgi:tRNA A-37 threonylcarbamoyl transferase component Bud32